MIICLCGNNKEDIIEELKNMYEIITLDYGSLRFQTTIECQKIYYDLLNNTSKRQITEEIDKKLMDEIMNSIKEKRKEFSIYIDNKIFNKINQLQNNNRDKIIVIISNNGYLSYDICQTPIFKKADLRLLMVSEIEELDLSNSDNKSVFDYVISDNKKLDIKKVLRL